MNMRIVIGIISFCVATTGSILSNMFLIMMIGEINRKRQEGNLVSYFGFTFPKMSRILSEYSSLYPNGKLRIYALVAFACSMIGLISVVACLGFFG